MIPGAEKVRDGVAKGVEACEAGGLGTANGRRGVAHKCPESEGARC